ncbi:DUF3718 domain-containing protein [Shewanella sp. GutDb-MelDb]|jgi:hypothetical protein|uniref:DUF3718 domain-containing protein n=1 Tax=Shewanella sp. GutDb-MelDb TaxID=2058316 RepID=UPI000C79A2C5|nr:DUF3718 domain-containing protein [Shewanella sp. GutDb-MelDb]PKG57630.1 hypothetical protein CXF82_08610 [Shewanella sp. GutDb-MelDb]
MIKFFAIAGTALAMTFSANAAMTPQMETALVSVCKAGASNSNYQFNSTMKSYRINKSRIFPKLVCNGESFYNFALNAGADKTAAKIAPYARGTVTIKDIAQTEQDDDLYVVNF